MTGNTSFENLREEVLVRIKPHAEEQSHDESSVHSFVSEVESVLRSSSIDAKIKVGGSYAKGTWLSGSKDIDVFLMFNYDKYNSEDISEIAKKVLEKHELEELHGSRVYFRMRYDDLEFEVIPVLGIDNANMQKNMMDVSPLHVDYVKSRLSDNKDEVRILKSFFKAKRMYGAESHIRGFSGYVCELLIIKYGSFLNLLENAGSFGNEAYIDIENYYSDVNEAKDALGRSKISPLIMIDPVQKNRNAASAVSIETFSKFVRLAGEFSKNPSTMMFEDEIIKIEKPCIHIVLKGVSDKSDKSAAMLHVVHQRLASVLCDFAIRKQDWEYDETDNEWHSYFMAEKDVLEPTKIIEGPPSAMKEAAGAFSNAHEDVYNEKERIYAREKRTMTSADEIIRNAMKDESNSKRAILQKVEVLL